jgi:hypothetical protein
VEREGGGEEERGRERRKEREKKRERDWKRNWLIGSHSASLIFARQASEK